MEERRKLICPSGLTFFGLTSNYRVFVFEQIHQIVFHGNGGYDWNTVYNMPIWLRKFTFRNIQEHYEKANKASSNKTTPARGPDISPSYTSKASKK